MPKNTVIIPDKEKLILFMKKISNIFNFMFDSTPFACTTKPVLRIYALPQLATKDTSGLGRM